MSEKRLKRDKLTYGMQGVVLRYSETVYIKPECISDPRMTNWVQARMKFVVLTQAF